jgi:hypothetical protein
VEEWPRGAFHQAIIRIGVAEVKFYKELCF